MSGALLLRDAEATLRQVATTDPMAPILHRYMSSWLLGAPPRADESALLTGTDVLRSYQSIAALAFAEAAGWIQSATRLDEGLRWLQAVALDRGGAPAPVTTDAVALLALGVVARSRSWLREWHQRACGFAASSIEPTWLRGAADLARGDSSTTVASEVRVALASKGIIASISEVETEVLRRLIDGEVPHEALHATVLLAALSWIRRASPIVTPGRATVDGVVTLLRSAERALQEWTWEDHARTRNGTARQWHVDNEYHVQNLLWAMLAPVFPDLRREEFRAQVGDLQPRLDLAIPTLRLIIEVKFARNGAALREVIREIAQDVSLYFVDTSTYDQIIVFVWDDARRVEDHDTLVSGLEQLPRVGGAVVVSRPGKMIAPAT